MTLRLASRLLWLVLLVMPLAVEAQPTCELPISAYVTDAAETPLSGTVDVELRFYSDPAPGAEPAECRSIPAATVDRGWLRLGVDGCAIPSPADCGVAPLSELFAHAPGVWVGVWIDGTELDPLIPVGAVPFAFRAGDADSLQGHSADDFVETDEFGGHTDDSDAHHSSTSDGLAITPSSVTVGDTQVESGRVDLGPDVTDELTDEIVRTLTGGGAADALHGHVSTGGNAGCYNVWGISTCLDGYSAASSGIAASFFWDGGAGGDPICLDSAVIEAYDRYWGGGSFWLVALGNTPQTVALNVTEVPCVICCPD